MLLLDITIVNVALPSIQKELHATLADVQWVIDAYALTLAALLLTAGSLGDIAGRKRLFTIGIVIFTGGSLLCGLATDPLFLTLSRAGQGVGGAMMFATSLALLASTFQGRERGIAFGVWGAVTGLAVAIGPVLGGVLTTGISWRAIFLVNVPIGVLLLAWPMQCVDESKDPHARRPDWIGFVLFSAGLAGIVYGLIRSSEDGWRSLTIYSIIAGVALLVLFVIVEFLEKQPMFDLQLLRKPTFVAGLVAAFSVSASIFSVFAYLILYIQNILGYSAIGAGVRFLTLSGAIFLTAGLAGRLTSRMTPRFLIGPGFIVVGVGLLLMRGLTVQSGWQHLLPGLILSGLGVGFVNVPLASTAVGVVETARSGMASGVNSTFRQVGVATGIAALGSIFAASVRSSVVQELSGTELADKSTLIAHNITSGIISTGLKSPAPHLLEKVEIAARTGFVNGLNDILLVAAILCFFASLVALTCIRRRDFVVSKT